MATVNKASLRTEFDALKASLRVVVVAEGKMSPESRALVDALLMLFELADGGVHGKAHAASAAPTPACPPLRARTSPPPAPAPAPRAWAPRTTRRAAPTPAPAARQGARRRLLRALRRRPHRHHACMSGHARRTLVDIVFEKVVRHADAEIKLAPRCHAEARARLSRRACPDRSSTAASRATSCTCSSRR